jgi:hypothetical protein
MSRAVPTMRPLGFSRMKKLGRKKLIAVTWARSLAVLSLFSVGTAIAQNNSLAAHPRTANDRFAMK